MRCLSRIVKNIASMPISSSSVGCLGSWHVEALNRRLKEIGRLEAADDDPSSAAPAPALPMAGAIAVPAQPAASAVDIPLPDPGPVDPVVAATNIALARIHARLSNIQKLVKKLQSKARDKLFRLLLRLSVGHCFEPIIDRVWICFAAPRERFR
jgi:hypothetical protein